MSIYEKAAESPDLRVLNLGAGVQSSTVALWMAMGDAAPVAIRPADVAIFADTRWEPAAVYTWLDELEQMLPFPVRRVTAGDIRAEALGGEHYSAMPLFIDTGTSIGRGQRQCTTDYKIVPIQKAIRAELGVTTLRGKVVEQVFGISWDEVRRMKDPTRQWERFDYPLIDHRITRADCLRWWKHAGMPEPPRSACIGCPFRSNAEWRHLQLTDPAGFQDAIDFDAAIRQPGAFRDTHKGVPYLHRSMQPLDQVDFRNAEDHGQLSWTEECEGMCGL